MLYEAIVSSLRKIERNLRFFSTSFPHVSIHGRYVPLENVEWTAGFWTGLLWLAFLASGKEEFKNTIQKLLPSFVNRLYLDIYTDTHDLGFLYLLSCVPDFELMKNRFSFSVALDAAAKLAKRFHPMGNYIQAFGKVPPEERETVIIVDSLMNLPLLYWAARRTGEEEYTQIASLHAQTVASLLVREDGSTYQACRFRFPEEEPVWLGTFQGYSDKSCWSRGQAWAIYGFALSYRYTGFSLFLEKALQVSEYFLNHLPYDRVCYWDLVFCEGNEPRDSSAAAIAVCGLLELAAILEVTDKERAAFLRREATDILQHLICNYASLPDDDCDGLLMHATYHLPKGWGIDESCIWGDYFYFEALLRLGSQFHSLWYYP